jgi:hypothetical protein
MAFQMMGHTIYVLVAVNLLAFSCSARTNPAMGECVVVASSLKVHGVMKLCGQAAPVPLLKDKLCFLW